MSKPRRITGQATTAKYGPVVKATAGRGYIRMKYRNYHAYSGVIGQNPLFPNWNREQYVATKRVFLRATDAGVYGQRVYQRYFMLANLYWQSYYGGLIGKLRWFIDHWIKTRLLGRLKRSQ